MEHKITSRIFLMKAQYRGDTGKVANTVTMSFDTHAALRAEMPWLDKGDRVMEFAGLDVCIDNQMPAGCVVCSHRDQHRIAS